MTETRRVARNQLAKVWRLLGGVTDRNRRGPKLAVLNYHSVLDSDNDLVGCVRPQLFETHIDMLVTKYNVLDLVQAMKLLSAGCLPERAVCVTFDDGYIDNYENAFPILKKYQCPATYFVVSKFIDGSQPLVTDHRFRPMTWEQLRLMGQSGLIDIQSHGKTHQRFSTLDDADIDLEISSSFQTITEEIGVVPTLLAYPNGQPRDIGDQAKQLVAKSNVEFAFSTIWGRVSDNSDQCAMPRIRVDSNDTATDVVSKINGDYDYVGYINRFRAFLGVDSKTAK